ncbi:MAG: hypothetical protein ROZ37_21920 [Aromatoleum sp.]|jgi:hypothetical protein|uniref:hypothetical protein n=1 Tax=Aromatoleum sp. TaxID=2307007 RepID=UPI002895E589|nr:hypothetical protein [Aromatoleum sp.]MDT3672981.1 hypothetical protein [Aromatoleum sp.]
MLRRIALTCARALLPFGLLLVFLGLLGRSHLAIDWLPFSAPLFHGVPVAGTFSTDLPATYDVEVWFERPSGQSLPATADLTVVWSIQSGTHTLAGATSVHPRVCLYSPDTLGAPLGRFEGSAHGRFSITAGTSDIAPSLSSLHPRIQVSLDGIQRESNLISLFFADLLLLGGAVLSVISLLALLALRLTGPGTA